MHGAFWRQGLSRRARGIQPLCWDLWARDSVNGRGARLGDRHLPQISQKNPALWRAFLEAERAEQRRAARVREAADRQARRAEELYWIEQEHMRLKRKREGQEVRDFVVGPAASSSAASSLPAPASAASSAAAPAAPAAAASSADQAVAAEEGEEDVEEGRGLFDSDSD